MTPAQWLKKSPQECSDWLDYAPSDGALLGKGHMYAPEVRGIQSAQTMWTAVFHWMCRRIFLRGGAVTLETWFHFNVQHIFEFNQVSLAWQVFMQQCTDAVRLSELEISTPWDGPVIVSIYADLSGRGGTGGEW